MMKFIPIFFLVGSCGLVEGMIREYIYYPGATDWYNAQRICREYYSDLATISTSEEQQQLVESFGFSSGPAWIGLYSQYVYSTWQWSDGEPVSFTPWYPGYPDTNYYTSKRGSDYGYKTCAFLEQGQWVNNFWWAGYPFYCYRYLILVNESKTWEEALRYCKTKYTGLASLPYTTQVLQAKTELALTQTESVWTGLRFMDGNWFWLSGEPTQSLDLLPSCPAHPYRCGALNNNTNAWENRDCNENLNFLCYLNIV